MIKRENIFQYIREHPVIFLFTLAVLIRILLMMFLPLPEQKLGGDFELYNRIAQSIILQGDFGGEPFETYGSPSINPGWSFFLAGVYFIFGISDLALLGMSLAFGGLLAVGTYFLARRFFNKHVALLSGVVVVFWPPFLIQSFVYADSLFFYTVLLFFSVFFFVKAVQEEQWLFVVVSALLLGFATLVDSIALFIPLVFFLWVLIQRPSLSPFKRIILFLIIFTLVLAPWTYRNISVAENMGLVEAPIISKGELELVSPTNLLLISKLVTHQGVLLSGLSKTFIFPFNISLLDQGTGLYYKDAVLRFVHGEYSVFSNKEKLILGTKMGITLVHWLLLTLCLLAFFIVGKRERAFLFFVAMLLVYVLVASIGYGSLRTDDFQSISALSSFLFSLVPFLIIIGSYSAFFIYKKHFCQLMKKAQDNLKKHE